MEKTEKTAIFIDYENVYWGLVNQYNFKPQIAHLISLILKEAEKEGDLLIKKAYADWERPEFHGAQAALKKAGVDPAFALSKKTVKEEVSVWKDTADAALMLDAQQTLYERKDISQFVLVTGDRAFLELIHRIKTQSKRVKICALETALAKELSDAVGKESLISIEGLLGIEPIGTTKISKTVPLIDGPVNWDVIIKSFYQLESKYPFVGLKLARDSYGFKNNIINEGIKLGIFEKYEVKNPVHGHSTAALKLNKTNDLVKKSLSES